MPRRIDAARRALPDLVIIGGQKCGTSSLFHYLSQHPQIRRPLSKEVHYFDLRYYRGDRWYRSHFPLQQHLQERQQVTGLRQITFEASPYYLYHPAVPARVRKDLPEAKFVVMLRNPVDRACSHYWHERRLGHEHLDLERALAMESQRLRGAAERLVQDARHASFSHRHHSYLSRGIYIEQIERWFAKFPRDRFFFIRSETFFSDPESQTERIFAFAGLPPCNGIRYAPRNVGEYTKLSPALRQELEEFYRPYNEALKSALAPEFTW